MLLFVNTLLIKINATRFVLKEECNWMPYKIYTWG